MPWRSATLPGADEPPDRLHGDLWSGNVLWDPHGTAWVIDPAAHGGHRETDLAMLALFGAPHLSRVLAAYHEHRPLAAGWRDRVALHSSTRCWSTPCCSAAPLAAGPSRRRPGPEAFARLNLG